jgi:hypothetical protein
MARRDADWLNTKTFIGYTALTRVFIIAVPGHLKELRETTNSFLQVKISSLLTVLQHDV